MAAADRVRVPAILSRERSMWLSVAAAVVGVVVVLGWVGATQPANRPFVAVAAVLLVVAAVGLLGRRTWLDPARGTVVRQVFFVFRAPVAWSEATRVAFTDNRAGQLLLEVRGPSRRSPIHLPLLAIDLGGDRGQAPAFLRLLAGQLETWAPERAEVARSLRAQADHVEGGGDLRSSPLARRLGGRRSTPGRPPAGAG